MSNQKPLIVPDKAILDIFGRQTYLGNTFIIGQDIASIATTTETPLLRVQNPATNSKSIFLNIKKLTCITANQFALFHIYYDPTITSNGTPVTPVNINLGSTNTSTAVTSTSPTASSNGTLVAVLPSSNGIPNESSVLQVIQPGHTMLLNVELSQNNARFIYEVMWYEI